MKQSLLLSVLVLFVFTTGSIAQDDTKEFDLSSRGIPVTVQAPLDATIDEGMLNGEMYDGVKTISWELNSAAFSLEATMDDEPMWQTAEESIGDWKMIATSDEAFVEFIVEDENGYIGKYKYGEEVAYEFYYQLVKGDRLIEFSFGLGSDDDSLDSIKRMYEAAKSAK